LIALPMVFVDYEWVGLLVMVAVVLEEIISLLVSVLKGGVGSGMPALGKVVYFPLLKPPI